MNEVTVMLDPWCAGSVLAAPVLDAQGGVLLAAGTTLSREQVEGLLRRGVQRISLRISEAEAEASQALAGTASALGAAQEPTAEQVQARLQQLFRLSLREGTINPLLYLVKRYRTGVSP